MLSANNLIIKIKQNKKEFILLLIILFIASFLRFYNIVDFLHFANDEARDAFVVKNIFNKGSLPLLGPETSIGHFHLGPLFYYLLIPFFLVFNFHPISGAIMSALLGILSVLLMWKLCREIFSKQAALIASFLYSISFMVVLHSRWSWNPNVVPFFFLLFLYSFYKLTSLNKNNAKYFYICIATLGALTQLHASTFILVPVAVIIFVIYRPKNLKWQHYLLSLFLLIILFLPFLIYEVINKLENFYKIIGVIFENTEGISLFEKIIFNFIGSIELINSLFLAIFSGFNDNFSFVDNNNIFRLTFLPGLIIFISLIVVSVVNIYKNKRKSKFIFPLFLFLIFLFIFSKKILFIHYYILFFPLIFILISYLLSLLFKKNIYGKILTGLIIMIIFFCNIFYTVKFFNGLNNNTWQKHHSITYLQMNKSINYLVDNAKNAKINVNCEINDYCKSFQYLLEINKIEINKSSDSKYKIYQSFDIELDFKPIQIEKVK